MESCNVHPRNTCFSGEERYNTATIQNLNIGDLTLAQVLLCDQSD